MQEMQLITMLYLCMVTDGNQTQHDGHFEMYRNIKSLYCVPGTNIVLQVNYTPKTKQIHGKRDQIYGYQRQGVGDRKLDEGGQKV